MSERPSDAPDEPARDVLAAEEFGLPAEDPALRRTPTVDLPAEPYPAAEAHDVLAAEEFAVPAGRSLAVRPGAAGDDDAESSSGRAASARARAAVGVAAAAAAVVTVLWRRRR